MSDGLTEQLRALVEGEARVMARVLHPRVVLRRLDASEVRGREAVLEALAAREEGARHHVVDAVGDELRVELRVQGVPGSVRFGLRGRAVAGRIIEVTVTSG